MIEVLFLSILSLIELMVDDLCIIHQIYRRFAREICSSSISCFPASVLSSDFHNSDVEHIKGRR